ncbi:MAG: bifunctional diguanylate cyclase/phosphodiesterase, partial [Caulobacteraceae bacterium]|nr:bifunctional diguanylate cyclase/phosphodiesterase [Caulobacteraceae bacterium]
MRILECVFEQHDLRLVALAAILCLVGSVITMRLYQRLGRAAGGERSAWIFLAAMAGGATIWCTHFVAMLAYHPGVAIGYEPMLTGVSLVAAILGGSVAFAVTCVKRPWAHAAGGALFALTISTMHYTGMAAFMVDAVIEWSPVYVAVSVILATALGAAAFQRAAASTGADRLAFFQGVGLLVLAIVALHFTGMSALTVIPLAPAAGALTGQSAETFMALAVAGVGLLVVGTGLASYLLDDQSRRRVKSHLENLVEGAVDGMVVQQAGRIIAANAAFSTLVETPRAELIGRPLSDWLETPELAPPGALARSNLLVGEASPIPVEMAVRRQGSANQADALMIYAIRDLRSRLAQERRVAHLARNDSLTGLPNRASFLEFLTARSEAPEAHLALLSLDLDRFKEVNDIHGHVAGDTMLIKVAERMRGVLRSGEFIARLGGDEFVAVMPIAERADALGLAERLRDAVIQPVDLEFGQLSVGVSMGVALWPEDSHTVTGLINDADLALSRSKAALTEDICFYEEEMDEAVRGRRRMVQALREALGQEQFTISYQVQATALTGEITGYEALLRWRRED